MVAKTNRDKYDKKEGKVMFARCTTMHFKIAFIDKALQVYKESIVPAAKSQKGFQNLHLFLDRATGKAISLALWDSEEDALANEESHYYQEQLVKLMSLFSQPPIKEGFEVVV
jgi:heme-degrading monooxygenase HmoA